MLWTYVHFAAPQPTNKNHWQDIGETDSKRPQVWIHVIEGDGATELKSSHESLIVSIMSVGTFLGALGAGDVADAIGRKWTLVMACAIFAFGVIIEIITGDGDGYAEIVIGRLIAGVGTGFESATVILYMSEIVSKPSSHANPPPKVYVLHCYERIMFTDIVTPKTVPT